MPGRISSPLRDRFGATYRLDFYDLADLTAIVERSARLLGVELKPDGAEAIARRGRGTPRVVNRLLRRVRDYAQIHGDGRVDAATADKALAALEIDDEGLDGTDRKLLAAIVQKFGSGPVGVQALAAVLAEEPETVEDVYEPFLLRLRLPRSDAARANSNRWRPPAPGPARLRDSAHSTWRWGAARPVGRQHRPGRVSHMTLESLADPAARRPRGVLRPPNSRF